MAIAAEESHRKMTIMLCMIATLFEGGDNIALALAAPKLALDYALLPYQIGVALSASLIGMMVGAAIGGRLADRLGRKVVLIGSMIALGLFSLATVATRHFEPLVLMRFLAGAGLGGAFPILIALSSEISHPAHRARTISLVHSGQPIGAAIQIERHGILPPGVRLSAQQVVSGGRMPHSIRVVDGQVLAMQITVSDKP